VEPTAYLVVAGLLVFAAASFFFALAESALFALGRWRARRLAERPGGAGVLRLLEQPEELLATIVLGNTLANAAVVALALWPALRGHWHPLASLGAALALVLVGCEILPKSLAVRAPEEWSLRVARPLLLLQGASGWFQRLARGFNEALIRFFVPRAGQRPGDVTDEEYRELVEMAFQQGALAQSEKEIILQIISLDRRTARDVMLPRSRMAAIPDDLSVEDMLAAARRHRHHRLPIYDETPDTIVGVLNARALLLDPHADLADVMEFPSFVPESMNLLQLLKSLQRQRRGLAIVMDEFGGTAGLVTMEDIMGEVVGRIHHEPASAGLVFEKLGEGRWRASGSMRVDDFRREYPDLGEVPDVDTLGGLVLRQCEVVPERGQSAQFRGLLLTVQEADERRVKELLIEVARKR
jgi:CBS domain containing-hemolysin-like protein